MTEVLSNENVVRLGFFFGTLLFVGLWEFYRPKRALSMRRSQRWPANFVIVALSTVLLKLTLPLTAVAFAFYCQSKGWGLLNFFALPETLSNVAAFVALDLVIYGQHVLFHRVPVFWRLHRMHHSDVDFDVSTGARFHPFEILISMGIKFVAIFAIGASPLAVLIFEIVLNATSTFNHGNILIPQRLDRILRRFVVTPDMHRIHHSVIEKETNSNYGFNLPWWDRLFGTYINEPVDGHEKMIIGLEYFRAPKFSKLLALIAQPFLKKSASSDL